MGVALGVLQANEATLDSEFETICNTLAGTRPTAVNLFWAIDRMKKVFAGVQRKVWQADSGNAGARSEADVSGGHRHQSRDRAKWGATWFPTARRC